MSAQFGILTTAPARDALTGIMIIQSLSISDENDFNELIAEDASIEEVQEVTKPKKISVEGITTSTITESGATLSIDGVNWLIQSVEVKEENEGWKTVSLEGILLGSIAVS